MLAERVHSGAQAPLKTRPGTTGMHVIWEICKVAGMRGNLCLLTLQTKRWQGKVQESSGRVQ